MYLLTLLLHFAMFILLSYHGEIKILILLLLLFNFISYIYEFIKLLMLNI